MPSLPVVPVKGFQAVKAANAASRASTAAVSAARHETVIDDLVTVVETNPSALQRLKDRLPTLFSKVPSATDVVNAMKNNKLATALIAYEIYDDGEQLLSWLTSDDGPKPTSSKDKALLDSIIARLKSEKPGSRITDPQAPEGTGSIRDATGAYVIERAHQAFRDDIMALGGPRRVAAMFRVLTTDEDYRNLWLALMIEGR